MKIVTICPITGQALYVSDVLPRLLHKGAKGDWGYSPNAEQAIELTAYQAKICFNTMTAKGRCPRYMIAKNYPADS